MVLNIGWEFCKVSRCFPEPWCPVAMFFGGIALFASGTGEHHQPPSGEGVGAMGESQLFPEYCFESSTVFFRQRTHILTSLVKALCWVKVKTLTGQAKGVRLHNSRGYSRR